MSVLKLDFEVHAKQPCHQIETVEEEVENCEACVMALDSWSQPLIEVPEIIFNQGTEWTTSLFEIADFEPLKISGTKFVYRPPPQVVWINAFHLPQLTTVIVI